MIIGKRCSVRCRCNRKVCQARKTLLRAPAEYARPPRCPRCRTGYLRPDTHRSGGKECYAPVCHCYGYSFPHARARGWCDHNPRLTLEDLEARSAWA